jgi:hypothetical protein
VARRLDVPRVTVDFSDVEEFEPLPKGEYTVIVDKVEYREAQDQDKYDYINWELVVTEEGEFKGRRLWFISSFSPKALWRFKQILENLGLFEDELEVDYDEESNLVTTPELAGVPALAGVSQRPYEGRMQNQVDTLTAIDGSPGKKEPGGKKKAPAKKTAAKKTTGRKFK